MKYLALLWLLQDLVQTFTIGLSLVPDIFMISIIYAALVDSGDREKQVKLIWMAFIGGILWDLRWTNLPGLTAAINGGMVAISCFIWEKLPAQGRSASTFTLLLISTQILSRLINIAFWTIPTQVAVRQITVQILLSIPIIVIFSYLYHKARGNRV